MGPQSGSIILSLTWCHQPSGYYDIAADLAQRQDDRGFLQEGRVNPRIFLDFEIQVLLSG